jgi:16S rRNA (guanine527-N7)-methyltransferase
MAHELWHRLAGGAGMALDEGRVGQLNAYLDLLLAANERMNLTRIVDRAQAEVLHVADALTLLPVLPAGAIRLADVGSGGGVPGMVLAIVRPEMAVVLVESSQKKAAFLRETAEALQLSNVRVEARRVEELGQSNQRETYDVAVARAVAVLDVLAEWLLPLVKRGGVALAMKGPKGLEEMKSAAVAIGKLGGGPAEVVGTAGADVNGSASDVSGTGVSGINLPGAEGHLLIRIPKIKATPARYPRLPAEAKGRPI